MLDLPWFSERLRDDNGWLQRRSAWHTAGSAALIDAGADVNIDATRKGSDLTGTALHSAALGGWPETVELLIKHGADVNARDSVSGDRPLINAVSPEPSPRDRLTVVKLLLAAGADVNQVDDSGHTVLYWAQEWKAPNEILDLLREHGAISK